MELIDREELKARLDRGDDFKLVMTMHQHQFEAAHIAGSVKVDSVDDAIRELDPDDEIVVYCSDRACAASRKAYEQLVQNGFKKVRHYEGGLSDWQNAGYPLEGTVVEE